MVKACGSHAAALLLFLSVHESEAQMLLAFHDESIRLPFSCFA
jgi:hypothetical protein